MQTPEREQQTPIKDNVGTIVKTSFIVALVAGLTSVIYFAAREQPKNFPVVIPVESQPEPPDRPISVAPQPKT